MAEQIVDYMIENGLMTKHQHGAMKELSQITAIMCIQDIIMKAAEQKEFTSILLIDLTAAYDLVDHEILDKKLKEYNYSEGTRKWIRSYLFQRTQTVEIQGKRSCTRYLSNYSTPQGSILAGLLYLIFSNDLPSPQDDKDTILYVDDTTDMIKDKSIINMRHKLQDEANKSVNWVNANRMIISEKKPNY